MNPKVVMLVLVILVLLFFVGVGRGLTQNGSISLEEFPSWVENLGDLLPRKRATLTDVLRSNNDSACLNRSAGLLTVPANLSCRYTLAPDSWPRLLELKLGAGLLAQVELHQPVKASGFLGKTHRENLESGDTVELDLFPQRNKNSRLQLVVLCRELTTACVLQILE
jgi:hypothetical protein